MMAGVQTFYQNTPPHNSLPPPLYPLVKLRFAETWEPPIEKTGFDAQQLRNADWQLFSQYLSNRYVRNLYYLGHGAADEIGGDYEEGTLIKKNSLETTLSRRGLIRLLRSSTAIDYRFVFLDGCSTGKKNLCEAFGIPRDEQMTLSEYRAKYGNSRLRTFIGWKREISTTATDTQANLTISLQLGPLRFLTTRAQFIATWASADRPSVTEKLKQAAITSFWFLGTEEFLLRKDGNPAGLGLLAVRGYRDLKIDEDNIY
jgi:hypothetical protein